MKLHDVLLQLLFVMMKFSLIGCAVEPWAVQTLFRRIGMEEARGRKDHRG
jgi:hypothetical protein